jgi:hypothetical protein
MIAVAGVSETVMAGTVMLTEPCWFGSETELAMTVMFRSEAGGVLGAVYVIAPPLAVAFAEMLPHCATPH